MILNHKKLTSNYFLWCAFILGILGYFILFFPGLLSIDSNTFFQQSISGTYSEHTTFFMVWVWHKLNKIYVTQAWMFIINMALLWGSVYLWSFRILQERWAQYCAVLAPYTIWIAVYAGWIWKDTLLAFGYLFLCTLFIYKSEKQQRFSWLGIAGILLLLGYCSEPKWAQARFMCPFFILWLIEINQPYWPRLKRWCVAILVSAAFIFSIHTLRAQFLKHTDRSYSWQFVNIYDLVGTSVYSNTYLVPNFLVLRPGLERLKEKYDLLWEPLIVYPDSPLRKTQSEAERKALTQAWIKAVTTHPIAYLQHRFYVFFRGILAASPLNGTITWSSWTQTYPLLYYIGVLGSYVWLFPTQLFFALRSKHSPVRNMNQIGAFFMTVLCIFSLAGVTRYVFASMVLCIFSMTYVLDKYLERKKWRG